MAAPEALAHKWVDAFVEFNITYKLSYLTVISILTIAAYSVIFYFSGASESSAAAFILFIILYLFWNIRICLSELRVGKKNSFSVSERIRFFIVLLMNFVIITIYFRNSAVPVTALMYVILGASLIPGAAFYVLNRVNIITSEIHIYYKLTAAASAVCIIISYFI